MPADLTFPLRLSFQVAATATLLVAIVGVPLAYLLARREFRGKEIVDLLVTLPMVLPPVVVGYYLLMVIGRNGLLGAVSTRLFGHAPQLTFTWGAAVIASAIVALPLTVKTARSAIEAVDPRLANASHLLGRGELATAALVVLPLAWRGILAGLTLSFARALGEFGATIVVAGNIPGRTNTMPLELYNLITFGDWGKATAVVVVFTTLSAAVLFGASRLGRAVRP
ncbi:MAG: molybdate ABC transporter permease subunit [Coriobacteriales bacterium]|nr:molybdate ABC transporter permease subunit [Coriobacteriales bacterium]